MGSKIRVLIEKPGLDEHDRGDLIISRILRAHGMEVIYTGRRQTPLQMAQTAVQEDVDVISLISFSGDHRTFFPKVIDALKERGASDIPVVGGVIPCEDIVFLIKKGIKKVFTSGSSPEAMVQYIQNLFDPKRQSLIEGPKKIAHIGIAVKSIDNVLSFYMDTLGLSLENVGNVASEGVKVAFLKAGESRIELLEPLIESSPIHQFINKKGEGIHHIALEVDDIDERLRKYRSEGIKLINDKSKTGANNNQIAFIHPKAANGVLFELCQHA